MRTKDIPTHFICGISSGLTKLLLDHGVLVTFKNVIMLLSTINLLVQ